MNRNAIPYLAVVLFGTVSVGLNAGDALAGPEETFQQARACMRGDGVPKDMKKAYALMKSAADAGHPDAIGGIGYFHSTGVVVTKDDAEALKWFRKGAEMGSAKSQLNLGKQLLENPPGASEGDIQEGLSWIIKAAGQGLAEAEFTYGRLLYFGESGAGQDYAKAADWFSRAAGENHAEARNFLGSMHELGLGVPVSIAEATTWYRKAALQGHARAQGNLGRAMDPLSEDKETRIEALAWLILGAGQGEVAAGKLINDTKPGLGDGDLERARLKSVELGKMIPRASVR